MKPPSRETFIIHIWWEAPCADNRQWHGQVQHVLSGETFSFQEPSALWRFIDHWRGMANDRDMINDRSMANTPGMTSTAKKQ